MASNIDKIRDIAKIAYSDYAKYDDVAKLLKGLLASIKEERQRLAETVALHKGEMANEVEEALNRMEETERTLEEMHAKHVEEMRSHLRTTTRQLQDEINRVRDEIPELPDLSPLEKQIKEVEAKIPTLDTAEDIRNKLELLQGDERPRWIVEQEKKLTELEEKLKTQPQTRVIAGPNANAVQYADLTSQCDGAKKTFEVPRHRYALMLFGTQFPNIYRPVTDFTTANRTLTLTAQVGAPDTGQTLVFLYIK